MSLYQYYNDEYIIVTVVYEMLNKCKIKQYGVRKKFIDKQHKHIAVNTWCLIMITDAGPDLPQHHS
jgi:hypothetical protein